MLEKNAKKLNFDAHFHYFECKNLGICTFPQDWSGISCAHTPEEWNIQIKATENIIHSYGIHPQQSGKIDIKSSADFLESLIIDNKLSAIGEAGFDYFTEEYKSYAVLQEEAFNIQLSLATKFNLPMVIHCRKANEKLFEYSKELSKLPEVLFHSFMGPSREAISLLNKGINGYFSFGKQIFNNNKKVLDCVSNLPAERVLAETDAPFQYLKGEKYTMPKEITAIKNEIMRIQGLS